MSVLPPGCVVVPCASTPRYNEFFGCLYRLREALPAGSAISMNQGADITFNINHGIRRGLSEPSLQWFWIVGDDHVFEPTIIERLWQHGRDVVAPFVLKRNWPHPPVMWKFPFEPITHEQLHGKQGLIEVDICGGAGMLIRRHVIEAIPDPWFQNQGTERQGEDVAFCRKLHEHLFDLCVDLDTPMGHLTPVEIWPHRNPENGRWGTRLQNKTTAEVI